MPSTPPRSEPPEIRFPTQEAWERMTPSEREAAIAALPDGDDLIAELIEDVDDLQAQRDAEAARAEAAERRADELQRELSVAQAEVQRLTSAGRPPDAGEEARQVRFERHEGSGHPLRAVYPDGSWLGVNRDHRGLYSMDARGRIVQLLGADRFHAASPRQFAQAYEQAFGHRLSARTEAPGE